MSLGAQDGCFQHLPHPTAQFPAGLPGLGNECLPCPVAVCAALLLPVPFPVIPGFFLDALATLFFFPTAFLVSVSLCHPVCVSFPGPPLLPRP